MKSYGMCTIWLLQLLSCILDSSTTVQASSTADAAATSPVASWEPSFTASSVQSTVVAISCQSAVVVLFYPGNSNRNKQQQRPATGNKSNSNIHWVDYDDLRVQFPQGPQQQIRRTVSSQTSWTVLGTSSHAASALCGMTGLASDVDYLSRVLLKQVDSNRILYEDSRTLPTRALVQALAGHLRTEAAYATGRPYGVQALVVGAVSAVSSNEKGKQQQPLGIFTLDPSGGVRHWGCATAIGKEALEVRKQLHTALVDRSSSKSLTARTALQVGLSALVLHEKEQQEEMTILPEAMIVWKEKQGSAICVATIDPEIVEECQTEARSTLKSS
jgi:20S proteasome alpha/beta subunit